MIFILMLIRWTLAALPLRSGHAPGLARPVPALHRQHRADGGGAAAVGDGADEARPALLPASRCSPGSALTAGHFFRNMGAPHRPRVRAQGRARRGDHPVPGGAPALLAAPALAAPAGAAGGRLAALRGLHDVRDGVPGALHLHRGGRAPEPRDREDAPSASTSISASACSAATAWRPARRTRSAWTPASWSSRPTAAAG